HADFDLRHVQPTGVLGRVVEFQALEEAVSRVYSRLYPGERTSRRSPDSECRTCRQAARVPSPAAAGNPPTGSAGARARACRRYRGKAWIWRGGAFYPACATDAFVRRSSPPAPSLACTMKDDAPWQPSRPL